jgi:hypothetical protein
MLFLDEIGTLSRRLAVLSFELPPLRALAVQRRGLACPRATGSGEPPGSRRALLGSVAEQLRVA